MNKLKKISALLCYGFFFIFAVLFSLANVLFTTRIYYEISNDVNYQFGITPINIVLVIVFLFVLWVLNKKNYFNINTNHYLTVFIVLVFILGIYWIVSNPNKFIAFDDTRSCYDAAKTILKGDYTPLSYKSYLNTYPHNIPLVTYFMLVIKIFGENNGAVAIRLINVVFVVIGYLYLYKITDKIFNNRKTNLNLITLMFLSLQFVFFSYNTYGTVMSISLSFISIYYLIDYIRNSNTISFVISIISIAFGAAMKNNVMIVLVAEIIYLIIYAITDRKWKYLLLSALMILSTIASTNGVIKYWERKANYSYDNKLPRICWIAYGFNYDPNNPGSYFDALEKYHFDNGYVVEYTEAKAREFIKESLETFSKNPQLMLRFYGQKLLVAWANPEYGAFSHNQLLSSKEISTINKSLIKGKLNNIINTIWDAVLSIVSIGLLIYIFKRKSKVALLELILAVVFIGGFIFHMFWELASRYMIQYYLCLLPYAAHGLMLLFNKKE